MRDKYFVRFINADGEEDGGEVEAVSLNDAIHKYQQQLRERDVARAGDRDFCAEVATRVRCSLEEK